MASKKNKTPETATKAPKVTQDGNTTRIEYDNIKDANAHMKRVAEEAKRVAEGVKGTVAHSRPTWALSEKEIEAKKEALGHELDEVAKVREEKSKVSLRLDEVKSLIKATELGQEQEELKISVKDLDNKINGLSANIERLSREVIERRTTEPQAAIPGTEARATKPKMHQDELPLEPPAPLTTQAVIVEGEFEEQTPSLADEVKRLLHEHGPLKVEQLCALLGWEEREGENWAKVIEALRRCGAVSASDRSTWSLPHQVHQLPERADGMPQEGAAVEAPALPALPALPPAPPVAERDLLKALKNQLSRSEAELAHALGTTSDAVKAGLQLLTDARCVEVVPGVEENYYRLPLLRDLVLGLVRRTPGVRLAELLEQAEAWKASEIEGKVDALINQGAIVVRGERHYLPEAAPPEGPKGGKKAKDKNRDSKPAKGSKGSKKGNASKAPAKAPARPAHAPTPAAQAPVELTDDETLILKVLREASPRGLTAQEVQRATNLPSYQVHLDGKGGMVRRGLLFALKGRYFAEKPGAGVGSTSPAASASSTPTITEAYELKLRGELRHFLLEQAQLKRAVRSAEALWLGDVLPEFEPRSRALFVEVFQELGQSGAIVVKGDFFELPEATGTPLASASELLEEIEGQAAQTATASSEPPAAEEPPAEALPIAPTSWGRVCHALLGSESSIGAIASAVGGPALGRGEALERFTLADLELTGKSAPTHDEMRPVLHLLGESGALVILEEEPLTYGLGACIDELYVGTGLSQRLADYFVELITDAPEPPTRQVLADGLEVPIGLVAYLADELLQDMRIKQQGQGADSVLVPLGTKTTKTPKAQAAE